MSDCESNAIVIYGFKLTAEEAEKAVEDVEFGEEFIFSNYREDPEEFWCGIELGSATYGDAVTLDTNRILLDYNKFNTVARVLGIWHEPSLILINTWS